MKEDQEYHFFATMSRMKYIHRWALMRNFREENLSEHCLEVAMIAHALCLLANIRYNRHTDPAAAALMGIYHDASEIITGDMPTPVKYYNSEIRGAYREVETAAEERLLSQLPEDLKSAYKEIFAGPDTEDGRYMRRLVKAADKLSALIKCIEEENSGNKEFHTAKITILNALDELKAKYPEVRDFMDEFISSYGNTLDELAI